MNLKNLKQAGDLNQEYNEAKAIYESKRKETRNNEIKKMKQEFRDFFLSDSDFTLSEQSGNIIAEYNKTKIILMDDEYYNRQEISMAVYVKLKLFESGLEHIIKALPHANKTFDPPRPGQKLTEEQIKIRDMEYYKAFTSGELTYSYTYMVGDTKKEYDSFTELLGNI